MKYSDSHLNIFHLDFLQESPLFTKDYAIVLNRVASQMQIPDDSFFWYPDFCALQIQGTSNIDVFWECDFIAAARDRSFHLACQNKKLNGPDYSLWLPSLSSLEKIDFLSNIAVWLWEPLPKYWNEVDMRFSFLPQSHTHVANRCFLQTVPVKISFEKSLSSKQSNAIVKIIAKWYTKAKLFGIAGDGPIVIKNNTLFLFDTMICLEVDLSRIRQESFNWFMMQLIPIHKISKISYVYFTPYYSVQEKIDDDLFSNIVSECRSKYSVVQALEMVRRRETEYKKTSCITFEEHFNLKDKHFDQIIID